MKKTIMLLLVFCLLATCLAGCRMSGTICDGAKPSCAAKIAAAVDAGILGYDMYLENQQFYSGDGIVTKGVDRTVTNVGRLAREGMKETDKTILEIMLNE